MATDSPNRKSLAESISMVAKSPMIFKFSFFNSLDRNGNNITLKFD